jgi:phosphatidylglycerol:prolipoprotein diacylglycerol transferase
VPTHLLASIALGFDPFLRVGDTGVRLETIALAVAILVALGLAALIAGRTLVHDPHAPAWAGAVDLRLRRDDLLFVVLGAIPGAVIGGRLGYVLLHLDYYAVNPGSIADPSQGSLELGLGVLAGAATGAYVCRLLDAPVGRWLHAATIPTLVAIALGELARVFGGSGQGLPADLPWATAYVGQGPWESLAPATAAHPAQVYGALAALVALGIVLALVRSGAFQARDGSAFFVGLLAWALARSLVTLAWRDDGVVGPLRAGTLIALGVAGAAVAGLVLTRIVTGRGRRQAHADHLPEPDPDVDWPDPLARPRF